MVKNILTDCTRNCLSLNRCLMIDKSCLSQRKPTVRTWKKGYYHLNHNSNRRTPISSAKPAHQQTLSSMQKLATWTRFIQPSGSRTRLGGNTLQFCLFDYSTNYSNKLLE